MSNQNTALEQPLVFPAPQEQDLRPVLPPLPMVAPISLDDKVREFEASLIRWALRATHGNKSRAAVLLQIKRSTLGDRIVRCGLDEPAAPEPEQAAV